MTRHASPANPGTLEADTEQGLSVFDKHRDTLEVHETMMGSARGRLAVAGVNSVEHVWDLLPRNQRW